MKIIFVGNEGVLVRGARASILVDALFGDGAGQFATTPREVIDAVENGHDPFAGVDLILATHHHEDHFNAQSTVRHMTRNPASRLLCTPQTASLIEKCGPGSDGLTGRIHVLQPREGVSQVVEIAGARVEAFGLSHGRAGYADVQQFGFVVDAGDGSFVHLGDGIIHERTLDTAGVLDRPIDAGFLPFWYLTYPFGIRLVTDRFRLGRTFGVHVPPSDSAELTARIAASFPDAVALVDPLSGFDVK